MGRGDLCQDPRAVLEGTDEILAHRPKEFHSIATAKFHGLLLMMVDCIPKLFVLEIIGEAVVWTEGIVGECSDVQFMMLFITPGLHFSTMTTDAEVAIQRAELPIWCLGRSCRVLLNLPLWMNR